MVVRNVVHTISQDENINQNFKDYFLHYVKH